MIPGLQHPNPRVLLWSARGEAHLSLAQSIRFQDYQFSYQTTAGRWYWTTRVDTSMSSPSYQVRDVISPFGLLRDSVPIPGGVILAMAESINEIKAAFAPVILIGPTTSLTFTIDEGRGFSVPQEMNITNVGVYGSILGTTITVADPFVKVSPANVGNLASNQTGSFEVTADSTNLLALNSPYASIVTVQDINATNTPQTFPVTVVVRPKATIATSPSTMTFYVTRNVDTTFPPIPYQQFNVQNIGPAGSSLDFQIQKLTGLSEWLIGFAPQSGTLTSSAIQPVQVIVQPPTGMNTGTYTETLRISGYSTNFHTDVVVQLTISLGIPP